MRDGASLSPPSTAVAHLLQSRRREWPRGCCTWLARALQLRLVQSLRRLLGDTLLLLCRGVKLQARPERARRVRDKDDLTAAGSFPRERSIMKRYRQALQNNALITGLSVDTSESGSPHNLKCSVRHAERKASPYSDSSNAGSTVTQQRYD